MGLATPHNFLIQPGVGTSSLMIKWPVRWEWPLPIMLPFRLSRDPLKVASPMGLATFKLRKVASPVGLATPHNVTFQAASRPLESGQSYGTGHFQIENSGQSGGTDHSP